MAKTDILLVEKVQSLGNEGEQKEVKAGYARNFLFPRGMAIPVNAANRKQIAALTARKEAREKKELEEANALDAKIQKINIAFPVKTGENGKMFGAVTAQDILARLEEEGISLEKKQIALHTPVKTLGKHTVTIKLHHDVSSELSFEVVSENPINN